MSRDNEIIAEVTLAEAAAWLTRLQAPDRTAATEAAFQDWLREPAHERAFARATDAWEIIPGAARLGEALAATDRMAPARRRGSRRLAMAIAASVVLAVVVGGTGAWLARDPVYTTRVGEQQVFTLSDGSRVALNTGSHLVVDFTKAERRVRLERGEAMFEVTKNPDRPFIVQAGEERVRVLGTTFTVRNDGRKVAVVLVEGRVEVTRETPRQSRPAPVAVLAPGERLTVRADAGAAIDRPRVEAVTAWRRGEVMFDATPLLDAAAELNRYGGTQVQVGDPTLASLRLSGVFQTHDPTEFARVAAELYDLHADREGDRIVLRR
jgi:transmembrane sensor